MGKARLRCCAAPATQIGGVRAPTPVGDLGNVEMTQALQLLETRWEAVGPDMLLTGYLPASGGLHGLHSELIGSSQPSTAAAASSANGAAPSQSSSARAAPAAAATAGAHHGANGLASPAAYPLPLLRPSRRRVTHSQVRRERRRARLAEYRLRPARVSLALCLCRGLPCQTIRCVGPGAGSVMTEPACMQVAEFYKVWDRYGALSNFSPHPVRLPCADGTLRVWPTVEHYYQAQKFAGVEDSAAAALMEARTVRSIPLVWNGVIFSPSVMHLCTAAVNVSERPAFKNS